MSSNSIPPSQKAPPLLLLAAFLENAHHRDDRVVSLPANTFNAITISRPPGAQYDMLEVEAIVLRLEHQDSVICERLDSLGLTIFCSIFIYSQECTAQQRGLCLLAEALHPNKLESAQKATHKHDKKLALGQAALNLLIKRFLQTDASRKLRRWLGILALELLEDCPENTERLQSEPSEEKHWQHLRNVIEHESCQVLKLLAGSMIREILNGGVSPDDFWPTMTGMDLYSRFPKSQHYNTQWVTSFEDFVDELVLEKILTQEVSSVMFAHAAFVGNRQWDLEGASDILVTVSEELNVIVPANDVNLAVYIDVPLDCILEVSCEREFVTDSQKPAYGVLIQLRSAVANNCILNATQYTEDHVAVAFDSAKDATTLRKLLMTTNVRTKGVPPHGQSRANDTSGPILSGDELAVPGPALSNSQILMRTASLASAIIPHRHAVSTINPSRLGLVRTSRRASTEHQEGSSSSVIEYDEDLQRIGQFVDMAAEVIDVSQNDDLIDQANNGIDVSHNDGLIDQANERIDVSQNDCLTEVEQGSEEGINVSGTDGLNHQEIQHLGIQARDFNSASSDARVHYSQALSHMRQEPKFPQKVVSFVKQVESKEGLVGKEGEHDDLYDASPRSTSIQRSSPRIPIMEVARSSANPSNPRSRPEFPWPASKQAATFPAQEDGPSKLDRPRESTARQAVVKTGPPSKLSRQLHTANGVVEPRTEKGADDDLATSTKNSGPDVKISANSKKSKAPASIKSTKPTKKAAQTKGKAIATEEPPNDSFVNYDLPPSPMRADPIVQTSENKSKTRTTRPKATKAPRNNQKQAKPVPATAAIMTSSKGPVTQSTKDTKKIVEANNSIQPSISNRPANKKINGDDPTIWDVEKAHNDEEPQIMSQSRQQTKGAKKQEGRTSKTEKTKAQTKTPRTRPVKAKPAATAFSQTRTRRTAAVEANKKLQGLDNFDDIVDDDEFVLLPRASNQNSASRAPKASTSQNIRGSNNGRPKFGGKLLTQKSSTKTFIPDSINPRSSEEQSKKTQRPESGSESKSKSSPETVDLVKGAPGKILLRNPNNTSNSLPTANPITTPEKSIALLHSDHDKHFSQSKPTSLDDGDGVNRAKSDLVPNSVPIRQENIDNTEPSGARSRRDHEVVDHRATDLAGAGDEDHVEDELPLVSKTQVDGVEKEDTAPQARMVVESRQRRTSPRLAEASQRALPESKAKKPDPFAAKLNAHFSKSRDLIAEPKAADSSSTPEPAALARPSRQPKTRVVDKLEARSCEEPKHLENPQRHLESVIQTEGEGEDSRIQFLNAAGESASTLGVESKRKIERLGNTTQKRVKLAPREQPGEVSIDRKPADDAEKTPLPVVSHKPVVIGFSKSGPRNQGTISTKKPDPPKDVEDRALRAVGLRNHNVSDATINQVKAGLKNAGDAQMKPGDPPQQTQFEHLTTVDTFAIPEMTAEEHRAQKRKLAPFADDPAPWEHEQLSKRQKRNIETPPTAHNHHPKMLPDPSPAMIHDRSQLLSSQHTRVNQNGSPMPFRITRNDNVAVEEQCLDEDDGKDALAEARLEEQFELQDDDLTLPEPILPLRPLLTAVSISQPKTTAHKSLSNNSKQVPSSPHAPSAFGTIPPHHVYHDGKIVNAETRESIIPVHPLDPFLGAPQNPQNPFMNALRKSTEVEARRFVSGINNKRGSGGVVTRPYHKVNEDPDKTLVEPDLSKGYKKVPLSDSSSSSQSDSPTQESQPDESSEEESDAETEAIWRKGLELHQKNMFDCLLKISHRLVRHLIDKETAVKDLVTDFEKHGNNLVESYEKALQDYFDSLEAKIDRRRQDLEKIYEQADADRARISKEVFEQPPVEEMKAQWEKQQEALMGSVAAALAACSE